MEHKIGTIYTLPDGTKTLVVEGGVCNDCILSNYFMECVAFKCECYTRSDGKYVIYKKIEN